MSINFNQVTKVEIPKYPYQQVEYLNFNGTDNYMYPKLLFGDIAIITEFEFSLSNINSGCIVGLEQLEGYLRIYADSGKLYIKSYEIGNELYYETMCTLTKDAKYKLRIEDTNPTVYLTLTQNETTLFSGSFHYYYRGEHQYGQEKAYLMARNLGGESLGTADQFATGKIYSFKQWGSGSGYPNNTHFVPIINTSTGDVGLVTNYSTYVETPYLMNGTITSSSIGNAVVPTIQFPLVEVTQIQRESTILWRNKRLVSIALSGQSTTLPQDTTFTFDGVVTATYSDGTTANVTSSTTFSGYNMSTAGTYTVTASYTDWGITKTATYQLTVKYYPYRLLDYIDIPSDAYVNLNEQGNNSCKIKLDINFNPDGTSSQVGSQNMFGAIYYNGSIYYRYHFTTTSNGLIQVWFGTGNSAYKDSGIYSNNNSRHTFELNYVSNNTLYVDDVNKGTYSTPASTNTGVMYLGARRFNNNGTVTINNYTRKIRVYGLEAINAYGTSIFYLVQRKSDNKIGLLKVFNDGEATRFCESETATDLIAGNVINDNWDYQ